MGSLDNNIRLIRNETVEGGNTKERIAETFELLAVELERKVNKDANKGLSSNDFSNEYKDKLEGLQQVDTSGLLQKGAYTGNASSLKADIDKKVSQEAGKSLSSNDYTNDEKQKNEENALKRVANLTVTGDVNKIITITFADSTVMQAPFKDNDHIPLADVHMNSLNFNENTGVLTGVKSDGNEISVSLDGRYSLIGHNHDERYAPKEHHHNEYSLRTHRHNKDDIDGLPNNLATTENVKTAIEGIQIGGRNYVLNSKPKLTSVGYMGQYWNLSEPVVIGEQYTFSCYATIEKERILCVYFIDVSGQPRQYIIDKLVNGYNKFTVIPNYAWSGLCVFYEVLGISPTPTATIEKLKFEKGNKPTDWSPAPEDFDFFKGNIQLSDLNTFKNRETGGFSVNTGGGWGAYLNFKLEGSTSSLEFFKPNWYPSSRMGIRNSVDSSRFNDDNGGFRDLAWYDDILRAGVECTQNSKLQREHQNQTIFVTVPCNIELNTIDDLSSVSFRKVFDNGIVSFSCTGKNIIYTSDNQFDGKKGSTAVISRYGNDCYIDIRNI